MPRSLIILFVLLALWSCSPSHTNNMTALTLDQIRIPNNEQAAIKAARVKKRISIDPTNDRFREMGRDSFDTHGYRVSMRAGWWGNWAQWEYNNRGWPISEMKASSHDWSINYYQLPIGRHLFAIMSDYFARIESVTRYDYDSTGKIERTITTNIGGKTGKTKTYKYDGVGRLVEETELEFHVYDDSLFKLLVHFEPYYFTKKQYFFTGQRLDSSISRTTGAAYGDYDNPLVNITYYDSIGLAQSLVLVTTHKRHEPITFRYEYYR